MRGTDLEFTAFLAAGSTEDSHEDLALLTVAVASPSSTVGSVKVETGDCDGKIGGTLA